MDGLEVLSILLTGVLCALAISVGGGGGALYAAVMMGVLGFSAHEGSRLSQAAGCGGSLAGVLINLMSRHPMLDRPLIDFNLVLFTGPSLLSGVMVGVLINKMIPPIGILALMVSFTGFASYKVCVRAVKIFKAWRRTKQQTKMKGRIREASGTVPSKAVDNNENDTSAVSSSIIHEFGNHILLKTKWPVSCYKKCSFRRLCGLLNLHITRPPKEAAALMMIWLVNIALAVVRASGTPHFKIV